MKILQLFADLLGETRRAVARMLGLRVGASEREVAEAILATAARVKELEAAQPQFAANVAAVLGCEPNETAVRAAIMTLTAPNDSRVHIREALALRPGVDDDAMVAAINELQLVRRKSEAEKLVAGAVEAGKITPEHRQFWLDNARHDLDSTRYALNGMRGH